VNYSYICTLTIKTRTMNSTQEQVRTAILSFAKLYDKEDNYKAIMDTYPGLPKIVEMIIYEMFLNMFNSYYCSKDEYAQYKVIYEYATELKEKGFVEFK
jgi:hypothetical protein